MMMACNVGEDEAANIEKRWRKALADINEKEPEIECVIACGIITGEKPYDLTRLIDESDKLMYADKRAIKISRGDDPDAR
jgi:PleD family two-component response regulator